MNKTLLSIIPLAVALTACNLPQITEYNLEVAPQTKKCVFGFGSPRDPNPNLSEKIMDCIQVRTDSSQPFYHSFDIPGFTFQSGYFYRIRVRNTYENKGYADDFGYTELIAIFEKTPVTK
jgi:Domain of unknown function (DUF4377)